MDLILWRHAHAEPNADSGLDIDRNLTSKGRQQATQMAVWLNNVLPLNCKIIVSPSQRTQQTALALDRRFEIVDEVGPDRTAHQIIAACNWPHNHEPVLVIGHQPHLSIVVSKLIPSIQQVAIRKGNVWWISQKNDAEPSMPFLKAVMTPELVVK